jgi:hypothetical protein
MKLRAFAALATTLGVVVFLLQVDRFLPLYRWQIWRYLAFWLVALGWGFSLTAAGDALLRRVLSRRLPMLEQLTLAFGLGLLLFGLTTFIVGLLGLLGRAYYFITPLVFAALGARPLVLYCRRWLAHVFRQPLRMTPVTLAVFAFGALGGSLIYFPIIAPSHVGVDSSIYHIPIAEHYVAAGAIRPFRDGWVPGAGPQLASLVYAWGLLTPGFDFVDRILVLAHLEYVVFLMTLLGISALASYLIGAGRASLAWVAIFLFPALFKHELQQAADHVAALWFPPLYLCFFRAWDEIDQRFTGLTASFAAAALLTKYTSIAMVVPVALGILGRGVALLFTKPERRTRTLAALGAALALGATLTAAHWLKNLLWYGDPVYPMLHGRLPSRPWNADAALFVGAYLNEIGTFTPERSLSGVLETIQAPFTFSFKSFEFYDYHRDVPYFGSLFTIASLTALFIGVARKTLGLILCLHVALAVWYWQSHAERYLQAILPGMAAVVAVVFRAAWSSGWLNRLPVALAVGLQLVWGADVFGLPLKVDWYRRALSVVGATFHGHDPYRTQGLGPFIEVSARLPKDAVVLVHDLQWHLGLERQSLNDWVGVQGGIQYARHVSARETHDLLRTLGATHLAWGFPSGDGSVAAELRFLDYAERFGRNRFEKAGLRVAEVPATPPPPEPPDSVLIQSCREPYAPGLYDFARTAVPVIQGRHLGKYPPPEVALTPENAPELVARATFAVTRGDPECCTACLSLIEKEMRPIGTRLGATLWSRGRATTELQR